MGQLCLRPHPRLSPTYNFQSSWQTLVNRKAEIRGKLEAFETNRLNRFEPAIRFVLEAKHGANLLAD